MVKILLLRPEESSKKLIEILKSSDYEVINIPIIKPISIIKLDHLKNILKNIFDYVIFTSQIGVRILWKYLTENNLTDSFLELCRSAKIIAIGPQTKEELTRIGLNIEIMPREFSSRGIIERIKNYPLRDKKILLIRSIHAKKDLDEYLARSGAIVSKLYTHKLELTDKVYDAINILINREVDSLILTSSMITEYLEDSLNKYGYTLREISNNIAIFSIGPVTSAVLRKIGVLNYVEADRYDSIGLYNAINKLYGGRK